jgi:riboflavin transporter FmnP
MRPKKLQKFWLLLMLVKKYEIKNKRNKRGTGSIANFVVIFVFFDKKEYDMQISKHRANTISSY